MEKRPLSFYILAAFFGLFVLFLYGPTLTIGILSFQGPQGGLTFPMNGVSTYWFHDLFREQAVGDIWGAFRRSFGLGLMVMVTTVVVSVLAGLAFRKRFAGSALVFYAAITSLVIPPILISLGVGLVVLAPPDAASALEAAGFAAIGHAVESSAQPGGAPVLWRRAGRAVTIPRAFTHFAGG